MYDTLVTWMHNGEVIDQHIMIMAERMEPSEAREYNAKNPLKAVLIFVNGNYDIQQGDWLVEEKDEPKRYAVLDDAENFADFHAEIHAERV